MYKTFDCLCQLLSYHYDFQYQYILHRSSLSTRCIFIFVEHDRMHDRNYLPKNITIDICYKYMENVIYGSFIFCWLVLINFKHITHVWLRNVCSFHLRAYCFLPLRKYTSGHLKVFIKLDMAVDVIAIKQRINRWKVMGSYQTLQKHL